MQELPVVPNKTYFNSHPHEEDDQSVASTEYLHQYFNSHPHEEDDYSERKTYTLGKHFNSHPHEEDDSHLP